MHEQKLSYRVTKWYCFFCVCFEESSTITTKINNSMDSMNINLLECVTAPRFPEGETNDIVLAVDPELEYDQGLFNLVVIVHLRWPCFQ